MTTDERPFDAFGLRVCEVLGLDIDKVSAVRLSHQVGGLPIVTAEFTVNLTELRRIIGE